MSESVTTRVPGHHRALGRNVLFKNVGAASFLFSMVFFLVIARRFGPAALGDLTVLLMVGSVTGLIFGNLGVNTTMVARMNGATGAARQQFAAAGFFWKIVFSALSFVLMIVAMRLGVHYGTWPEILAVAVISVGGLWVEFLSALTNGVNRLGVEANLRHAHRAIVYGGGACLAFFLGLAGVLIFMAGATILVLSCAFLLIRARVMPVGLPLSYEIVPAFLKESVPVWITQISQLTYLKLDIVVLGLLHVAARQIGWYAAGWKVVDVLTMVPALLAAAVLPLISGALPDTDASDIAPAYLKAMYVLPFFFILPMAVGAGWITRLLYGSAFTGTAGVLRILVWALAPYCVHSLLVTVAVATGRQLEAARLGMVTAAFGLLAAVVFVPLYGYQAIAVTSLAANSGFAIAMVHRFRNVTGSTHAATGLKSLGGALAVFGLAVFLGGDIPAWVMTFGSVVAYGGVLLILGVFNLRDVGRGWRLAGSLLSNRTAGKVSVA
jgi:O-antigen/teichoic acid export membrane protein